MNPLMDKDDERPITVSEAYHLLLPLKSRYKNIRAESYQIFIKTLEYTETFGRIKDKSAVLDLNVALVELGFSNAEIASLGTILPQNSDEAKILIPSIVRLDNSIIEQAIEKIQSII